jgi:hypothetical protein
MRLVAPLSTSPPGPPLGPSPGPLTLDSPSTLAVSSPSFTVWLLNMGTCAATGHAAARRAKGGGLIAPPTGVPVVGGDSFTANHLLPAGSGGPCRSVTLAHTHHSTRPGPQHARTHQQSESGRRPVHGLLALLRRVLHLRVQETAIHVHTPSTHPPSQPRVHTCNSSGGVPTSHPKPQLGGSWGKGGGGR